jgi:leucyl aminopeptidase
MDTSKRHPLELVIETSSPEKVHTGVLVVGAFADGTLPPASRRIDEASKGKLSAVVKRGDLDGKAGSSVMLYDVPGTEAERVLLVSLGTREGFGDKAFRDALKGAATALANGPAHEAVVTLTDVEVPGRSSTWRAQTASRLIADGAYRFAAPGARSARKSQERGARKVTLLTADRVNGDVIDAIRRGQAVAEGMALAKDLGNLPGNVCNPAFLAETARSLGKVHKFDVDVLEREDMRRLGMGAALSVGQASAAPCKFIVMHYKGGGAGAKPVVLIGKGITFDTGGISLKPGADMDEMKFDMCGAASVFGAMKTVARLGLPINVVAIIHAAENMPGGNASRPGDVVTSMSGQTIEILNTDAEGRLGLADALTYAERFDPEYVIDVATLTGACVIALGKETSGLWANDDELADRLLQSGVQAGDRAWRMPMFDEYQDMLKSNFADMSNLGGRAAGAITAACFLQRFANHFKWAHLDIAGTNAVSGDAKGATGRPVPLLAEFLLARTDGTTSPPMSDAREARPSSRPASKKRSAAARAVPAWGAARVVRRKRRARRARA